MPIVNKDTGFILFSKVVLRHSNFEVWWSVCTLYNDHFITNLGLQRAGERKLKIGSSGEISLRTST